MKNFLKISLYFCVFLLNQTIALAQDSKKNEDRKQVKIQLLSNGVPLLPNQFLSADKNEIGIKVFPVETNEAKLVITDFEVILIRKGRKIAEQSFSGVVGSIKNLAEKAMNDDTIAIKIKEVFEVTKEGYLKSYVKGKILMNILYK